MSGNSKWERRDVDTTLLYGIMALFIICGVLAFMACKGTMVILNKHSGPLATAPTQSAFPEPALQVAPGLALEALRKSEAIELNSAAWIDRERGVVRIPIDRAIELLSKRGLPETTERLTPLQLQQQRPEERKGMP